MRLQIAGLSTGHDETLVLGSVSARQFSVLCFRSGVLAAVESVNRPADHVAARRVMALARRPDREHAGQPGFNLKGWATATV